MRGGHRRGTTALGNGVTSLITEELVRLGVEVTLFATQDSLTKAELQAVCPRGYEEDRETHPKVWESLHIAHCFERAEDFDLIHNQFDFLPLSYSRLVRTPVVTTIHGFSSEKILPVYQKYDASTHYVSISDADRCPKLNYEATIYHGIDTENFTFCPKPTDDYLLYFSRFHPEKGAQEAIEIARRADKKLIMAGVIQDRDYFDRCVTPAVKTGMVEYVGSVGPERRDALLGGAVALLHPISFDEPFGLSVVEAMACGTPVIAFDRGSMPEIIDHGKTGYRVNSIQEAVTSVEKIAAIDRRACRNAVEERFSKERMASDYLQLYKRILSQYPGK